MFRGEKGEAERADRAYVVKIVERWARDASSIAARGARAHGRVCVHEERKKVLNELTGRSPEGGAPLVSGIPFTLDGSVTEIGGDDGEACRWPFYGFPDFSRRFFFVLS